MKNKIYYCLLFAVILIASCTSKPEPVIKALIDDKNNTVFPLGSLIDGAAIIHIDSLFDELFCIKPELTENSIIAQYSKIIIKDSMLFIMDNSKSNQAIFVFDMKGKYLFNINKRGQGSGEYRSIDDFYVDNKTKTIGLLDHSQILRYDYSGNFLGKLDLRRHYIHNIVGVDSLIYTYGYAQCSTKNCYSFKIFNLKGDLLYEDMPERKDLISFPLTGLKNDNLFVDTDNKVYYNSIYSDTIYEVSMNKITPRYITDFGKYKMPGDIYSDLVKRGDRDAASSLSHAINSNYAIFGIENMLFTKDHCYFRFSLGNKGYFGYYSKKTSTLKITYSFISRGIFPRHTQLASDENFFYGDISSYDMVNHKKLYEEHGFLDPSFESPPELREEYEKMRQHYYEVLKDAKEDDNNTIIVSKLRDF